MRVYSSVLLKGMSQDVPYQKGDVGFLLRRNAARPPAICVCLTVNKELLLLDERRLESPRILVGRERRRVGNAGCSQQKTNKQFIG